MTARIIEAEARISAVDATGSTFEAIAKKVKVLQSAFKGMSGVATSGIANMSKSIGRVNEIVKTVAPMAASAAAYEGMRGVQDLVRQTVKQSAALAHEQVSNQLAGIPEPERDEADKLSLEISQRYKVFNQADTLATLRSMRSIVGTFEEAAKLLDRITRLKVVALQASPERAAELNEDIDKLMKGDEIIGATQDPARFVKDLDLTARALQVFNKTLRPYDFFEFMQHSRLAGQGFSDEFLFGVGPTLMQHMGGAAAGTAMSALFQQFIGGHMTQAAANMMEKYGLLDQSKVEFTKAGLIKRALPGALKDSDEMKSDPYRWIQDVFLPALRAHGVTTKEQFEDIGAVLASKATTGYALGVFGTQAQNIEKDLALERGAMGDSDKAMKVIGHDPFIAAQGVGAQLENLLAIAGGPLSGPAAGGLNEIADALIHLENAAKQVPALAAAGLIGGGTLLAGGAVGLGQWGLRRMFGAPLAEAGGGSWLSTVAGTAGPLGLIALGGYGLSKTAADDVWHDPKTYSALADKDDPMLAAMGGDYSIAAAIANASKGAEVKGSADLNVKVEVEPSDSFIARIISELRNEINAFGGGAAEPGGGVGTAGSTGLSMPPATPNP